MNDEQIEDLAVEIASNVRTLGQSIVTAVDPELQFAARCEYVKWLRETIARHLKEAGDEAKMSPGCHDVWDLYEEESP